MNRIVTAVNTAPKMLPASPNTEAVIPGRFWASHSAAWCSEPVKSPSLFTCLTTSWFLSSCESDGSASTRSRSWL